MTNKTAYTFDPSYMTTFTSPDDIKAVAENRARAVPFAHLTDMLPGEVTQEADVLNDWMVAARDYTAGRLRGEKPATAPGDDMLSVLTALVAMTKAAKRAVNAQPEAAMERTLQERIERLPAGYALVTVRTEAALNRLLESLAGTTLTNIRTLRDMEQALERHTLLNSNQPLPMLPYVDTGTVWWQMERFYLSKNEEVFYPGAWDGCDERVMHEVVCNWLIAIARKSYETSPSSEYVHLLTSLTALAVRRPHIYPVLVGVRQWIADNAENIELSDKALSRLPLVYKDIKDMQALASVTFHMMNYLPDSQLTTREVVNLLYDRVGAFVPRTTLLRSAAQYSVDGDKVVVEYCARPRDLLTGKRTKTTPGRFINKVLDNITSADVKYLADTITGLLVPPPVEYISDLDPEEWSEAYLQGHGFHSCMTPEDEDDSIYMAVRAYCSRAFAPYDMQERMDELALAVMRHPETGQVVARSIVNKTSKEYVRVYGDDRLRSALERDGYEENTEALNGCYLYLGVPSEDEDNVGDADRASRYYCPYLDGVMGFEFERSDHTTWCYSKGHDGILVKLITAGRALDLMEDECSVYRGKSTSGYLYWGDTAEEDDFE